MADTFLQTYAPLANDIATRTGLDATVVLGLIDTETGRGQHVVGSNIYGISPGGRVARYPNVETATEAFINLINSPRYASVAAARDPAAQAAALVRSGYNTVNPNYASLVGGKAQTFGKQLGYQDAAAPAPTVAPAAPAAPAATTQAAPASSPKERALAEVGGGDAAAPAAPAAPAAAPAAPQSARERALAEVDSSQQDPTLTGPKTAEKTTAAPQTPPTVGVDEYGRELGPGGFPVGDSPMSPALDVTGRIADAAKAGWSNTEPFLTPKGQEAVGPVGSFVSSAILDNPRRALNALMAGGGAGIMEATAPITVGPEGGQDAGPGWGARLGRDINQLIAMAPMAGVMGEANALRPSTPRPAPYPEIPAGGWRARPEPEAGPPPTPAMIPPDAPLPPPNALQRVPPTPTAAPPPAFVPPQGEPVPPLGPGTALQTGSVGSAVTEQWRPLRPGEAVPPGHETAIDQTGARFVRTIPEETRGEKVTNLDKTVAQGAHDRLQPGLRDDNVYVESTPEYPVPPRPEAYRNFDPQKALDHKTFYNTDTTYRKQIDAIDRDRHNGMSDRIKDDMGDGNSLEDHEAARKEVTPEKLGVFDGEKPVNPELLEAYRAKLEAVINGPAGKRTGVRSILNGVYKTLFDSEGNLETLPSRLQGVRDEMTDWLAKRHGSDALAKDAKAAQAILTQAVEDLNPVMMSGAPKWDLFRQQWAERSQPINQQSFLQRYRPGTSKSLWDRDNKLIFRKVDGLLADIAAAQRKPVHDAHSLTPAQIENITNTRNELATEDLARRQADVAGSPTVQLLSNAAKRGAGPVGVAVRTAAEYGAHAVGAAAAAHGVPGINAALGMWQASRPARQALKASKSAAATEAQLNALKQNLLSQQRHPNALGPD